MKKRKSPDVGVFFLLLLLLLIHFLGGVAVFPKPEKPTFEKTVFVQASGNVRYPGVYGFKKPPCPAGLVHRAGGLVPAGTLSFPAGTMSLSPGSQVVITRKQEKVEIRIGPLSPFYRLTLGMPISINGDTASGLTAVPGIGPRTAAAIVQARERTGGFRKLKDLMSIRGIGPSLYQKISPYLTL